MSRLIQDLNPGQNGDGNSAETTTTTTAAASAAFSNSMDARKPSQLPQLRPPRKKRKATMVLAVGASRDRNSTSSDPIVSITNDEFLPEKSAAATNVANGVPILHPLDEDSNTDTTSFQFSSNHHLPLELVPPIIPENTTGKPSLSFFCTTYPKPKTQRSSARPTTASTTTQPNDVSEIQWTGPPGQLVATDVSRHQQIHQHAGPVVQIVNGEIVLQESSIVFHGSGAETGIVDTNIGDAQRTDIMTIVEEEAEMAVVGATYTSFAMGRRARPKVSHWTVEETQLFYEALRQVGLDFGTMEAYFESSENSNIRKRLRRQLKRKYQAECSKNPGLIEKALQPRGRVDIDLSVFQLTEESVQEMRVEKEKELQSRTAKALTLTPIALYEDIAVVVEKDAVNKRQEFIRPNLSSNDTNDDFLWPDTGNDDDVVENTENEEVIFENDPIFFEDSGNTTVCVTVDQSALQLDGLVDETTRMHSAYPIPTKISKTRKPKFRSTVRR